MKKMSPLQYNLSFTKLYPAVARVVSYGGALPEQLKGPFASLKEEHGQAMLLAALTDLTGRGAGEDGVYRLTAEARKLCRVVLGPEPTSVEYEAYWALQGERPPREHQDALGRKQPQEAADAVKEGDGEVKEKKPRAKATAGGKRGK